MTLTTQEPAVVSHLHHPPARSRGRFATVLVLIGSLMAAGTMREWASSRQAAVNNIHGTAAARSSLGNMDSFALALMLGGLRGPLVMFLWPAIENQKADHNLEDIDTMIEWVRLLQPEFDSVHMFQIWNKAYNLSAMMTSPANKYSVIMESLDYGASVDKERPGDVNILSAMQNVYGGKFGAINLPEYHFYSRQFREESMTEKNRAAKYPEDKTYARLDKWQPLLDDDGNIRADLLEPARERTPENRDDAEWNDGSELQYLKAFAPFPYGVGPLAMSYNYAKRAEVALNDEGQRPLQLTAMVIDSQPALALQFWAEDDSRRVRVAEAQAFNVPLANTDEEIEQNLTTVFPTVKAARLESVNSAIYYYQNAMKVSQTAITEYNRHLSKPEYAGWRTEVYRPHLVEMEAGIEINTADTEYLRGVLATKQEDKKRYFASASSHYKDAANRYERIVLRFYMEDEAIWSPGIMPADARPHDKVAVINLSDLVLDSVFEKSMVRANLLPLGQQDHSNERASYGIRVRRCKSRINAIQAML